MDELGKVDILRIRITDEIFAALKLKKDGYARKVLGPLFHLPTQRFANIFSEIDEAINSGGIPSGCRVAVDQFGIDLDTRGNNQIPKEGPLLIVSNHPGAYDSVSIGSCLQRNDLKVIVWETPFYHALENADKWFIYSTEDQAGRMIAIRQAIEHLQNGGALLQFGSGLIEPDPAYVGHTEEWLQNWSSSIEIMLRKVPQTMLILATVSGVLLRKFARHPLTLLVNGGVNQRRVAEFTQVISQLIFPKSVKINTKISFCNPVTVTNLEEESKDGRLLPSILRREAILLQEHLTVFNLPQS